ncbi:Phosphate-starvation-inducible E family protein [Spironucleus salmonicida]|uniref:Phosphate-starvation-inducible E family protein n=1 Tax=Spironucleus salmonicida TaxID=348837 RepID=V6LMM8_9EUKA|nr:Phosphate-starvation-inducible E family protein [Spironucleus salmonicida]|eukprot:EST45942.1 Transmembrane domain-containing protein [Spironucleus salmonicida]
MDRHLRSSFSENNFDQFQHNYRLSKEFKFNREHPSTDAPLSPQTNLQNEELKRELQEAFNLDLVEDESVINHRHDDEEMSMTDKAIIEYHQQSSFFNVFILKFIKQMHKLESIVNLILLIILVVFIVCSLISVCYQTYIMFRDDPHFVLGQSQYPLWLDGVFFVLIGVELAKSILAQLGHDNSYIEVIVMVAITAVARSIVIQEYKGDLDPVFGMALLMVALGICIFLLKLSNKQ